MNREVTQAWVDALRSGDYRQTRGVLSRVDMDGSKGFCCLGVLCNLAVKAGLIPPPEHDPARGVDIYDRSYLRPSELVHWWVGMPYLTVDTPQGLPGLQGQTIPLETLNDTHNFSFDQIADAIEMTYLREEAYA